MRAIVFVAALCLSGIVLAAPPDAATSTRLPTSIPAQDLGSALRTLEKDRNLQLVFIAEDVKSVNTRGASGELTSDEALKQILSGTGLTYRFLDKDTVSVVPTRTSATEASGTNPPKTGRASSVEASASDNENRIRLAQTDTAAGGSSAPSAQAPGPADSRSRTVGSANDEDKGTRLEEIVVTSQKRVENLQDVPIAVTALSSMQLGDANIDGQQTLPKLTPNLNFTAVAETVSAYIRGVGTQFAHPGLESSVSVYLDDTYVPRAVSALFSFNDVERIEVLKGPQGTLYGRNATGGAIRIITYDPQQKFEIAASTSYGTDNRIEADGMVNMPINDQLAVRFAARHDQNDGYADNTFNGGKLQTRDESTYAAKALFISGPVKFKLSADYTGKNDSDGEAFFNLFPGAPQQIGALVGGCTSSSFYSGCDNGRSRGEVRAFGLTARLDYDAGFATLSSITASRTESDHVCGDLDGTGTNLEQVCGHTSTRQYTQEFQITSNGSGPLKYVGGFYYLYEKSAYPFDIYGDAIDGTLGAAFGVPVGSVFQSSAEGVRTESYAPYAQVDYAITDQFSITGGIRYTDETKKLLGSAGGVGMVGPEGFAVPGSVTFGAAGPCTVPAEVLCREQATTAKFTKVTPKLTLSYKPVEQVLLYATWSRGFKSGGFNLPSFGTTDVVKPETLDDTEIGWKIEHGNVRWNGAAFYYNYKDLQIQITDQTTGGTRVKNAAGAHIKGVESDVTWDPIERLELGIGGGFLDSEYRNFIGDAYLSNAPAPGLTLTGGQNQSGNQLVDAPKFSGYVQVQYTQPIDGLGNLRFSVLPNYRSTSYFDPANQFADHSRLMLSSKITLTSLDDHYFMSVYGENLTNRQYNVSESPQATGGWRTPAPPRQIYVQVGLKF